MDPAALKKNFEDQIAQTVKQITELEDNLKTENEKKTGIKTWLNEN